MFRSGVFESLGQILYDIVDMFDTYGKPDHSRRNSGFRKLFVVHLTVGVAGGMENHGFGSRYMSGDICHIKAVHETYGCFPSALQFKGNNAAGTVGKIFLCQLIIFVVRKPRVIYRSNLGMS